MVETEYKCQQKASMKQTTVAKNQSNRIIQLTPDKLMAYSINTEPHQNHKHFSSASNGLHSFLCMTHPVNHIQSTSQ